jgi:hypothetical protein
VEALEAPIRDHRASLCLARYPGGGKVDDRHIHHHVACHDYVEGVPLPCGLADDLVG